MIKLALIGDTHIHEKSARFDHVLEVLDWTIDDALSAGATHFVWLGDICEGEPSSAENVVLLTRLLRITKHAFLMVVLGNHESDDALEWWKLLPIPRLRRVASTEIVSFHDEASILLVPYPRRGKPPFHDLEYDGSIRGSMRAAADRIALETKKELDAIAEVAPGTPLIVAGHFTVAGMTTRDTAFEVHRADEVVVPQEAFAGVALVAVGHIHKAQDVASNIIGVGSLIREDFAEKEDDKSYTLVTVTPTEAAPTSRGDAPVIWERRRVPAHEMAVFSFELLPGGEIKLPDDVEAQARGKEVKVKLRIAQQLTATFDEAIFDPIKNVAALFDLDRETIPVERVRAPEIGQAETVWDEVQTYLRTTSQAITPEREAPLRHKVDEIEAVVRTNA